MKHLRKSKLSRRNQQNTTIIPAGYRVSVLSCEDNSRKKEYYNTKWISLQTAAQTQFVVDLCKLVCGCSCYGNLRNPNHQEIEKFNDAVFELMEKHNSSILYTSWDSVENVVKILHDLGLQECECFTRICESIKVEFFPVDIRIEDVTPRFME